jgi:hypothetical protein
MLTNEKKGKFGAGALLCYGWGAHAACRSFNPLALELDIYSSAHHLCKM